MRTHLRLRTDWLRALSLGALLSAAVSGCFVPEFTYDGEWPGSGGDSNDSGGNGPADGGNGGSTGGAGDGGNDSGGSGGDETGGTSGDTGGGGSGGDGTGGDGGSGGVDGGSGGADGGSGGGGGGSGGDGSGGATGETQVFLLYGQSNMWGVAPPEEDDLIASASVEVLTLVSCSEHGANEWVTAQPPLHGCVGMPSGSTTGPGLGPGDYFMRAMAAEYPNDTILLVPAAVPGAAIDDLAWGTANYDALVSRAQMAQERGEIRGILFHQGESDSGDATWPQAVADFVTDLKSDLGIGHVPFLAGELPSAGCCSSHNSMIAQLPTLIPNTFVIQAAELPVLDGYHFNAASVRTLGERYGAAMVEALAP